MEHVNRMADGNETPKLGEAAFSAHDVTALLQRLSGGDVEAISRVMSLLYTDLRNIAAGKLRRERPDHTLEPAALVNETFLQLARKRDIQWTNRGHFLAAASQEMRRLLVDYARAHNSQKRGGGLSKIPLDDCGLALRDNPEEFLIVNELLDRLATEDDRAARVVEMRCYGGLTNHEIGEILGIDERTVKRDWSFALARIRSQFHKSGKNASRGMVPS